jgi:hypothetical protein
MNKGHLNYLKQHDGLADSFEKIVNTLDEVEKNEV